MSHSGNGWKGAEAINHRNATFSDFTRSCGHFYSAFYLEYSAYETLFHHFHFLLLVRPGTKVILD